MPNDLNENRPQNPIKSNFELPDVDTVMERLALISGERSASGIMRWLGIKPSSIANWKRRGSVNFDPIIAGLLRHRVSLDWLFAPYEDLFYPTVGQLGELNESTPLYQQNQAMNLAIEAINRIDPVLERYNLPKTETNRQLMSETYFKKRGEALILSAALNQVAKALATAQPNEASQAD